MASAAAFSGAVLRFMSRSSRRRISVQDGLVFGLLAPAQQLEVPAPGPLLGRRGDEELHVRVRADHGADVAPVEHGARCLRGELALEGQKRVPHRLVGRDHRGGLAHRGAPQAGIVQMARRPGSAATSAAASRSASGDVPVDEHAGDGPVEQAGIEMGEAEMLGEALAQGSLAGGGGTVDGDDHGRLNPGSSRRAPA